MKQNFRITILSITTNGIPKEWKNAEEDLTNYPPLLNLSGKVIDYNFATNNFTLFTEFNKFVKPKTDKIIVGKYNPDTISLQDVSNIGESLEDVLLYYQGVVNSTDLIVTYNYSFLRNVLLTELTNNKINSLIRKGTKVICLMKLYLNILRLENKKHPNVFKFPTLLEINNILFNDNKEEFKTNKEMLDTIEEIILISLKKENVFGENTKNLILGYLNSYNKIY